MKNEKATRVFQLAVAVATSVVGVAGLLGIAFGHPRLGVGYAGMGAAIALLAQRISERKREQDELRSMNEVLEQRVLSRTAELNATNKELEAFSYSVAHDLRAPLRHMNGFIQLLSKHSSGSLDEKSQRYLGIINESASKMGHLIDDLLDFSRVSRTELQMHVLSINQLVDEVLHELRLEIQDRNITWRVAALPEILADRSMMRLVFLNLVANAVKFTSRRELAEIEMGCLEETPDEMVLFIRDNGVGFDMKYANKLFGVFQRLHRSEDYEGTGIGLASVQRIIHRHGGRVWAKGEVEVGATFYLALPKTLEAQNNAKVQAHAAG